MSTQKNYGVMHVGPFKALAEKGRVMAEEGLGLTGCELSFNSVPKGQRSPFFHTHKLNEEVYIVLRGSGSFQVDDEEFAITEGDIVRVAPAGVRAIHAGDAELVYICIQAQKDSLTQATMDDGVMLPQD